MNLVLIGNGRWAEKIANSRHVLDSMENVERISASSFLSGQSNSRFGNTNIVWITSRPSLQPEVLSKLQNSSCYVIVEKPLGLTLTDFELLKTGELFEENRLRLSRVWNYSQIWTDFISESHIKFDQIEISRGGPHQNSNIPCHVDWMPHDIYLLASLYGEELLHCEVSRLAVLNELLEAEFYLGDSKVVVNFKTGYFPNKRVAEWKLFHKGELALTIDFKNCQRVYANGDAKSSPGVKDAISKMLEGIKFIEKSSVALDIEIQRNFAIRLLGLN